MKAFSFVFLALAILASCSQENGMLIEGTVPQAFNGLNAYIVPVPYPKAENVDSARIKNGKFRFKVQADHIRICHLTVSRKAKAPFEMLLVAVEPGRLEAKIDTFSHCHGTPLNDTLQSWKDYMGSCGEAAFQFAMQAQQEKDPLRSAAINAKRDSLYALAGDYTYRLIKSNPNPLGGYLYFINRNSLDSLQLGELHSMGMDAWLPVKNK